MIDLLELANLRNGLLQFKDYNHIYQVLDSDGKLRCLLKVFCEDDEQLARNEACVYLLDHPEDDHRSRSQQIYGFSGVRPSVFVRFKKGNEKVIGVLVEFVETNNICSPCWISWLSHNANKAFSLRSINYVARLNPDNDIEFLHRCGWEPKNGYDEKLKVFATFLKKAVSQGLTAFHIGLIASYKCEEPKFNLQDMIDGVTRDDKFFESVYIRIEERLREYYEKM